MWRRGKNPHRWKSRPDKSERYHAGTNPLSMAPMSTRPFAVGGRLAVPSVSIAAEPGSVGAPLVGARGEGRHEACPYVVIELRKV